MDKRVIGALWLCLGALAPAADYTFYLSHHQFKAGNGDVPHEVTDEFGNRFILETGTEDSRRLAIAKSLVLDMAGLPNATVYPTFVLQFGEGPVWLMPEVPPVPTIRWAPATIRPFVRSDRGDDLKARAVSELLGIWSVAYLLGMSPSDNVVDYSLSQRPFLKAGQPLFSDYSGNGSFARYLARVPPKQWERMERWDSRFVLGLNEILSRLEKITPEQWDTVFEHQFRQPNGPAARAELLRRQSLLRKNFVESAERYFADAALLKEPEPVPPPQLLLPPRDPAKALGKIDRLWQAYFDPEAKLDLTIYAFREYRIEAGREDIRISEVGHHMEPLIRGETLAQLALNERNRRTLFVYADNDMEAGETSRLVREANGHAFDLGLPHGAQLTVEEVKRIRDEITRLGKAGIEIDRIIVSEIPGRPEVEAQLRVKGRELLIVDHHFHLNYDRYRVRSSLEQTCQIMGIKIPPQSRSISVFDSAFVAGALDLGVPREMILAKIEKVTPPPDTRKYPLRNGSLVVLKSPLAGVKEYSMQLIYEHHPVPVSLFNIHPEGIHFQGPDALMRKLEALIRPLIRDDTHFYSGGSLHRARYLEFRADASTIARIVKTYLKILEDEEGLDLARGTYPTPIFPLCHAVNAAAAT